MDGCTFAEYLARVTSQAPDAAAERLAETLRQECLNEAAEGLSSCVWNAQFDGRGGLRFVEKVVRRFATKVENAGFARVEWWSGKEWRPSQGSFSILYNSTYNEYTTRLRVEWDPNLAEVVDLGTPVRQYNSCGSDVSMGATATDSEAFLLQVHDAMQAQQRALESWLSELQLSERRARPQPDILDATAPVAGGSDCGDEAAVGKSTMEAEDSSSVFV